MNFTVKKIVLTDDLQSKGSHSSDYENTYTDVIVVVEEEDEGGGLLEKKYVAAFFTYGSIHTIRKENEEKGEFLDGKYFWANNMLLVDKGSKENIEKVVHHIIEEGDFRDIFKKL